MSAQGKAVESGDTSDNSTLATMEIPKKSLRRFPPEIRLRIFNEVFTELPVPRNADLDRIPRKTKEGLIEALRSERDQTVYKEALEVYYKNVTVEITVGTLERIQGMHHDALSLIKHLAITYRLPSPKPRHLTLVPLIQPTDKLLSSMATTLKSLTILFERDITFSQACVALPYELPVFLNSFVKLESVTMILPNENDRNNVFYHGQENQQCAKDLMVTCREAMHLNGAVWADVNHQISKIQFTVQQAEEPKVPEEKDINKDAAVEKGEASSKNVKNRVLEWKEERIGDGWLGKCTCGLNHEVDDDEAAAAHHGFDQAVQTDIPDDLAAMFGFMGHHGFMLPGTYPPSVMSSPTPYEWPALSDDDLPELRPLNEDPSNDDWETTAGSSASQWPVPWDSDDDLPELRSLTEDPSNDSYETTAGSTASPEELSFDTPSQSTPAGTLHDNSTLYNLFPRVDGEECLPAGGDEAGSHELDDIISGAWDNDDYDEGMYCEDGEEYF